MAETYIAMGTDHDRSKVIVGMIIRTTQDRQFRAELRRDPFGTTTQAGLDLSAAEWAGLREVLSDWWRRKDASDASMIEIIRDNSEQGPCNGSLHISGVPCRLKVVTCRPANGPGMPWIEHVEATPYETSGD